MAVADPTLEFEATLFSSGARYVIGCDEVGRGAIAGPVAVGVAVVAADAPAMPQGLRDSKMLSEPRREQLAPAAASWALHSAVGLASAAEVDALGIMIALGLAGLRALTAVDPSGALRRESVVLLDGTHDWLSPALETRTAVRSRAKADRDCASVAAASVIAKVHRDRMMIEWDADHPPYGWRGNKGYASSEHLAAIEQHGVTELHRRTWLRTDTTLPGLEPGSLLESAPGSPVGSPLGSALGSPVGSPLGESA